MEVSQPRDTSQGIETQGEKAGKKKRRKKKESSAAASPEAREEVDPGKAATSAAEESKRKKHKSKSGKRKHHDHQGTAPEPNPENAEGAATPVGQEEAPVSAIRGEDKVQQQEHDDYKQSVPGAVEPQKHERPVQQVQKEEQQPESEEPQQKTQEEVTEQLQEPNQLKQSEEAGGPDVKAKSEGPRSLPASEKRLSPRKQNSEDYPRLYTIQVAYQSAVQVVARPVRTCESKSESLWKILEDIAASDEKNIMGELSLLPGPMPILAVCIFSALGVPLSVLIFKMFPRPAYRCLNPACTDILDYMEAIVDKSVKPCHDFYRHVCGHWLPKASQAATTSSPSFMADVLRNYTARRHRLMMERAGMAEPADAVSRYYSHCFAYLSVQRSLQDIVSKVFEVYNITAPTWLKMSSDQIFSQLLRLSFISRLHALFKITTGKIERKNYIAVDRWTSFQQRLPNMLSQDHTYLAAVLKVIGGKDINAAIIASCAALDNSVGLNKAQLPNSSTSLAPASNTDCPEFPPGKWVEGANSQSEVKLSPGTSVFARDFSATCSDLRSVLLHETPMVKALYPLALIVANFLKLGFTPTSESRIDPESVQTVCHQDTMTTFKRLWLPSLTKVLSISPTTAQTVDDYFTVILTTIKQEAPAFLKWMSDADRTTTLSDSKDMHIARFSNGSLSAEEVDNSRYNPSSGMVENDWIYSKLNILRRTKIADDVDEDAAIPGDEQYAETVEVQLLADSETKAVVVPHMFALSPLFFDVIARGSYANLAVLGFQMARKMTSLLFRRRADPWWSKETDSNYITARTCYANFSAAFHGSLSDAEFDEAFEAAVAMKAAFEASSLLVEDMPEREAPFSSKQLFFKRACLSLCAGAKPRGDFNSLDRDTASAACTIAVSSMSEFHEAFACGGTDQMRLPLRCNI